MKSHLAALAGALLLTAPSAALAQAGSKGAVKVGVLLPLTGNTAWAGKTNRIAAAIAAEEVNAQDLAGGYKIELVFGDSQCEPRPAHDQAQRLISQEKVQLLIGEWCSSASIAVAQVANDEKIPLLVNISTADQIAGDAGPYAFQSSMQNRYSQQREAALLEKDFKFESVAIIVENNDFGLTFRKNMVALMQKAGKKVVLDVTQAVFGHPWMPPIDYVPLWKDPIRNLSIVMLPALTIGYRYAAVSMRMTRSAMLEVLREDYIRTARAKGLVRRLIINRHALKNALLPVVTVIGIEFAFLLGGLVVTEQVFNLNGIGRLMVLSVQNQDYTLTQALVMVVVTIAVLSNLVVDLLYAWLDPRIRLA